MKVQDGVNRGLEVAEWLVVGHAGDGHSGENEGKTTIVEEIGVALIESGGGRGLGERKPESESSYQESRGDEGGTLKGGKKTWAAN